MKRDLWILLSLACLGCSGSGTASLTRASTYACGVGPGEYVAELGEDEDGPFLSMREEAVGARPMRGPATLHFSDFFDGGDADLRFEPADREGEGFFRTWHLRSARIGGERVNLGKRIASNTGMRHMRVHALRVAFSREALAHDDAGHEHPATHLWFGVYEQQIGQKRPAWCMVSAPVSMKVEGSRASIEITKTSQQSVTAGEKAEAEPHHH